MVNSSKCAEESSENFELLTTDGAILVFELYSLDKEAVIEFSVEGHML